MVAAPLIRRSRSFKGILGLVVIASFLGLTFFVWLQVARTLTKGASPTAPIGKPKAIAWGDRVFSDRAEFDAWLRARGSSYAAWAARHRQGVGVLEHRRLPPAQRRVVVAAARPPVAAARRVASGVTVSGGHSLGGVATALFWAFALLLGAAALAPVQLVGRVTMRRFPTEQRVIVAAVGAAIALALLVSSSLP